MRMVQRAAILRILSTHAPLRALCASEIRHCSKTLVPVATLALNVAIFSSLGRGERQFAPVNAGPSLNPRLVYPLHTPLPTPLPTVYMPLNQGGADQNC